MRTAPSCTIIAASRATRARPFARLLEGCKAGTSTRSARWFIFTRPPSYSAPLNRAYLSLRVKDRVRAVPRAVGSQATCHAMEVTQEDLQRQCAGQYDAYIKCVSEGGAENCLTQQHELEQCATATVQLVRAINSSCGKQYAQFQACFKRAGERQIANPDCDRPSAAFWECAQVQIDRAGEQVM